MWAQLATPGVIDAGIGLIAVVSGLWADADIPRPAGYGLMTSIAAVVVLAARIWQTDREVRLLKKVDKDVTVLGSEADELRQKRAKVISDVQEYGAIVADLKQTLALMDAAHNRDVEVIGALRAERVADRNEIAIIREELDALRLKFRGAPDGAEVSAE